MNRSHQQAAIATLSKVNPSTITLAKRIGEHSLFIGSTREGERVMTVMPTLKANAPPRWRRTYFARIECNLTGRCPACEAVVGTSTNPNAHAHHENNCPVLDPGLGRWVLTDD